jgi:hypothetical protein
LERKSLADNDYVYFAVSSWKHNEAIKLKARGPERSIQWLLERFYA